MNKVVVKKIEDKEIVWFKNSNSYLVLEPIAAAILLKINKNNSLEEIKTWAFKKITAPKKVVKKFIEDIFLLYTVNNTLKKEVQNNSGTYKIPTKYYSEKYYSIHNCIFKIQFQTGFHLLKIHPIFAHLETESQNKFHFNYTIFDDKDFIVFFKNDAFIGKWNKNETHLFEGKLSMHLIIDIYKKPETDWMGVFHASAISNKKESLLFLGDSGNGKSTSLALLNANGFDCIADDFVPIDNKKNMYTYPAAMSIKKKSLKTLLPVYPELKNAVEYHFKKMNKTVRYLPPKNINYHLKLKCKALVFIKYNIEVELEINSISKIDAFQQLIPDSWISPLEKNVSVFLEWFLELPCYQLTYSNNLKMIETVTKIFNNDL
ncbi:HPr kinase/phosphorylase [Polaribacter huanghezhanensis]|uniref:hypothetical protein n=1 Tax=Polaribacter huanghezhanensis TaxID=1354726 RepID=UPI0026476D24|nr:hypothetical protein [Polaribacter huanghezhanensis]WKD84919.1 HPr kinase/phosphorylase [Polaribacter huanghezhanensis]